MTGAEEGTRTPTGFLPQPPQSCVSANSTTSAHISCMKKCSRFKGVDQLKKDNAQSLLLAFLACKKNKSFSSHFLITKKHLMHNFVFYSIFYDLEYTHKKLILSKNLYGNTRYFITSQDQNYFYFSI